MDDRNARLFPDADELRKRIDPDTRTLITTEYLDLIHASDPDPNNMTQEWSTKSTSS